MLTSAGVDDAISLMTIAVRRLTERTTTKL